jgi:3-oxoacyl-[acyl-carrier-protein] synthase II
MRKKLFINAASTISHQPTFGAVGFSASLSPLVAGHELIQPAYKTYIDPVLLRRMSRILRMGVTCAQEALRVGGVDVPSGIIVGTGLGCLQDTEKFLQNFLTLDGLLPPTAFILSTHNTVAGQISLSIGCHGYNVTHTQNTVSFEMAMLDGILKLEEGATDLLVGAADEHIPFLDSVADAWGYQEVFLTSGASFFVLSSEVSERNHVEVVDVWMAVGQEGDSRAAVDNFLAAQGLALSDIGLVIGSDSVTASALGYSGEWMDYVSLSGLYPTASAFGFHLGVDVLRRRSDVKYAMIFNHLSPTNLGLVLLKTIEA